MLFVIFLKTKSEMKCNEMTWNNIYLYSLHFFACQLRDQSCTLTMIVLLPYYMYETYENFFFSGRKKKNP